jgi:acetyltransferase
MARVLLERFRGETYLVNPSGTAILDRPTYPTVSAIGTPIDLAVVAVASERVLEALADCARAGVGGAVVIATRPIDHDPAAFDEKLLAVARSGGMRIIGPNCVGIDSAAIGLNSWGALTSSAPGHVAVITQSGGIGDHALRQLRLRGMGVSH